MISRTSSYNSGTIDLKVGSGGKASQRFIKEHIIERFGNPILNSLEDGSYIPYNGNDLIVTTDSFIIDPPIFPGGDIGKLCITGTINDLVASGAKPLYIALSLIMSEGFLIESIEVVLDSISCAVEDSDVVIVAGDTKVIDKRSFTGIIITTTGIGVPTRPKFSYALDNAKPLDNIIITGTIGDHGLSLLSFREGLGFEQRVQSDCAALDKLLLPLIQRFEGIHCMRDPTRGGVFNVLCDIVEKSSIFVVLDEESLPIQMEVQMGCEMLGIDPLLLPNEGKMVLIVSPEESHAILGALRQSPLGARSAIIGQLFECPSGKEGYVAVKEKNALKVRVRPEGDILPRLC